MKKLLTFVLVLAMVLSVSSVALAVSTDGDLRAAINSANSGDTITLTGDVTLGTALEINRDGVDLTLDLGTHTLYGGISLKGGRLTVKNGTISNPNPGGTAIWLTASSDVNASQTQLVIEENVTINSEYGVVLSGNGEKGYNATIDIKGKINAVAPVWVLGTLKEGNCVVNIKSPAELTSTASGAVDKSVGVAVAGFATVNIEEGTKITGDTGVEVRAGTLNVKGGTIVCTGGPTTSTPNSSGTTTSGAAIAVSQHTTNLPIVVNISGGTIKATGANGKALYACDVQSPGGAESTINVSGGNFIGEVGLGTGEIAPSLTNNRFISGGTFSEKPAANLIALDNVAVGDVDGEGYVIKVKVDWASIHVSPTTLDFGTADYGYSAISPKALIVTNDGDTLVKVPTPTHDSYIFEIDDGGNDLFPGESIVFNVSPKAGLPVGAYNVYGIVDGIIDIAPSPSADRDGAANETVSQEVSLSFTVKSISTGSGISVKYTGGNGFSTSNSAVPTGVEIDNVPVSFTGDGRNFTVSCIKPDAKWVTVRWNSTSVTTNFTPDAAAYCSPTNIPKTGDASLAAFVVMAIVAAAGAMRRK